MLTVVIYRKSSQSFIDRYRSLLQPYLDTGKIAFCFWDENGDDVSSSVLKLSETVRGITRWRAIVALPLDAGMEEKELSQSCRTNPFDYAENSDPEPKVRESEIPLIRLAQMLGGVPLPSMHYEGTTKIDSTGTCLRIMRREDEDSLAREQDAWEEINTKYSFDFDRPASLYLFAARIRREIEIPEATDQEILDRHESDSSLFWYRNRYPARARFLIQDCSRPRHARYHQDLFCFWMTVMALALNDMPSGMLEAYKLYQVKAAVDPDQLHRVFSDYYNRLGNIQFVASKNIIELQKSAQYAREMDELPHYQATVPVEFHVDETGGMLIPDKGIGFAGDCPIDEEPWWQASVEAGLQQLRRIFRSLQIVLDRASISCRYGAHVMDSEIHELDEYQVQDMQEELTDLENEILVFNTYTALPVRLFYRDLHAVRKSGATSMRKRMTRRCTIVAGLFVLLIYLAGFIPDFVNQYKNGTVFSDAFLIAFLGCDILAIAMIICLFHFRSVIRMKIRDYNGVVKRILTNIRHAGDVFSNYLSKCCSYMRGKRMLQALADRSMVSSLSIKLLSLHKEKLDEQMKVIKDWLSDFGMQPLPDKGEFGRIDFDFDIMPEMNREYLLHLDYFDLGRRMSGGSRCMAPYPFVAGLKVRRESIFEQSEEAAEDEEEDKS